MVDIYSRAQFEIRDILSAKCLFFLSFYVCLAPRITPGVFLYYVALLRLIDRCHFFHQLFMFPTTFKRFNSVCARRKKAVSFCVVALKKSLSTQNAIQHNVSFLQWTHLFILLISPNKSDNDLFEARCFK